MDDLAMLYDEAMDADPAHASPKDLPDRDLRLLTEWERLRIVYNAILSVEVLIGFLAFRSIEDVILEAIAANVCFCAGPVADGYLRRLGFRGRTPTLVLFGLGTVLSMVIVFLMIVSQILAHGPH